MFVLVEERQSALNEYVALFEQEGIAVTGFSFSECEEWLMFASEADLLSVEAFLLGRSDECLTLTKRIHKRCTVPVLAIADHYTLEETLALFQCGVDDVLHQPFHVREVLARIAAIRRRTGNNLPGKAMALEFGAIRIFNDGRDPQINGEELPLPRRERRIFEYLVNHHGRRVSKAQIFNAIYGSFNDEVEENVIESHISKLRKKLKRRLGYDVINSKRFLGYRLVLNKEAEGGKACFE